MIKFHENNIHAAIFDMDGTMFDTERLRFQTLKQASLELIGVEFTDAYLLSCLGLSARSAEKLANQQYGQEVPYAEIRKRADQLELEHVRKYGVPIKFGLMQVLERLRKSNLKMAVATSSRREIAEEYLINANVYKFFDIIVCGDEVDNGKPHPEIFLKAAEQLNIDPTLCLMFEDSENGVMSAFEAGGLTVLLQDIKEPNSTMLEKANFFYESMHDFLEDLNQFTPKLKMPALFDSFPQTLNQHVVGIHGFGAIGGGYIAQVLSHWDGYTRPKQIYASTRNSLYRNSVNTFGGYSIRYGQHSHDERIDNITVIDASNIEMMQHMYIESSLIALCLPEKAIEQEAKTIAQGLYARYIHFEEQLNPLTVLIVLNKVGAKSLIEQQICSALHEITDAKTVNIIMSQHYFCDTVVNRMVAKITDQKLFRQLKIKYNIFRHVQDEHDLDVTDVDEGTRLNAEQEQLATQYIDDLYEKFKSAHILQNLELILFHAETDMPLYVENNSPLLEKMRQMILVEEIEEIQLIKNRMWNGVHAMTAWAASFRQYETIGIALSDEQISKFMLAVLHEVKVGLKDLLPHRKENLELLAKSFIDSCETAYKDPCDRVARDPYRKLGFGERVLSSLAYNFQRGKPYQEILKGLVLGYAYVILKQNQRLEDVIRYFAQQLSQTELELEDQLYLQEELKRRLKICDPKLSESVNEHALLENILNEKVEVEKT